MTAARRLILLIGLAGGAAAVLPGSALGVTTACYALPSAAPDRSLVGSVAETPVTPWSAAGTTRTRFALQLLVKGPQGMVFFSVARYKVVGLLRSDIPDPRAPEVEGFASLGTISYDSSVLVPSVSLGRGGPSVSVTPDLVNHTVSARAETDGLHAKYVFRPAAPLIEAKRTGRAVKLEMSAASEITVSGDGGGTSTFAPVGDTAHVPGAIGVGSLRAEHWRKIDCRTGFDGKAPELPATLPGTYQCTWASPLRPRHYQSIPTPPNGAYDLRLRADGTYAFGPGTAYAGGAFTFTKNRLAFGSGYLSGVKGTWIARLGDFVTKNAQGVDLSAFPISPGAEPARHACVKT